MRGLICHLAVGIGTIGLLCVASERAQASVFWRPVTPEELALKAPKVDSASDAEALSYEVEVEDESRFERTIRRYALRIKIFNERGKAAFAQANIYHDEDVRVSEVAARTVRPDGAIVEVKDSDIFERTVVRGRGAKVKATSFALPAVEVGSIVEYRWIEFHKGSFTHYATIPVQIAVPVQQLRLAIRSDNLPPGYHMRLDSLGVSLGSMNAEPGPAGQTLSVWKITNIPAFVEEPDMPPEETSRASVFIRYTDKDNETAEAFWSRWSKEFYKELGKIAKAAKATTVEDIVTGATTPMEKARRICEFCRDQIKHLEDDASGLTPDQVRETKANKTPEDTVARRVGTNREIVEAFGALATAAGLVTRVVVLPDRSKALFDPAIFNPRWLNNIVVAVEIDGQWQYFDPSETYVGCGRLRWQNEGVQALVVDSKGGKFVKIPISPASDSVTTRSAKLRLAEDGTLEGDVVLGYGGHLGEEHKELYDAETPERRDELLRNGLKERMSAAEVTQVRFEGVTLPGDTMSIAYHVRVPGYARRTGKRLFLQPSYFRYGYAPRFTAQTRKNPLYFDYPWSEKDKIEIELPSGFDLENPDAPADLKVGELVLSSMGLAVTTGTPRVLKVERQFSFGGAGSVLFGPKAYDDLKNVFDILHASDNHMLTLRQEGGTQ